MFGTTVIDDRAADDPAVRRFAREFPAPVGRQALLGCATLKRNWGICLLAAISLLSGARVQAQGTWERLESRIRQQLQQPAPDAQPEVVPAPNAAPAPGTNLLPQMIAQPGAVAQAGAGKPYLGILADDRNDRGRGIRVLKVFPGGPGEKAGLQEQDLITSLADVRVRQMSELADILELYSAGDQVAVDIQRDNQPRKLRLTLAARPAGEAAPSGSTAPASVIPKLPPNPPLPGPELMPATPPATETLPSADDRSRIIALERRVAELERRLQELERRLPKAE